MAKHLVVVLALGRLKSEQKSVMFRREERELFQTYKREHGLFQEKMFIVVESRMLDGCKSGQQKLLKVSQIGKI